HLTYDAFGLITSQTDAAFTPHFSYTGREFDADLDLYDYRARYYDPHLGRFISEDPMSFAADDANLYRYVGNSPTFMVDPTGNFGFGDLLAIDAAIVFAPFRLVKRVGEGLGTAAAIVYKGVTDPCITGAEFIAYGAVALLGMASAPIVAVPNLVNGVRDSIHEYRKGNYSGGTEKLTDSLLDFGLIVVGTFGGPGAGAGAIEREIGLIADTAESMRTAGTTVEKLMSTGRALRAELLAEGLASRTTADITTAERAIVEGASAKRNV